MKILVIGGSGYIGTVFIKKMIEEGHQIRCLDRRRFNSSCLQNYNDNLTHLEIIIGDIRVEQDLIKGLKDIDAVVNFAAIVGSPSCAKNPAEAWSVNVGGAQLLSKLAPTEIPVVQLSTCSVYGNVKQKICDENDKTDPLTIYAETKLQAEEAIIARNGVVLRPVTAYGPSPTPRLDLFLHTLVGFGIRGEIFNLYEPEAIRPMIYIDDLVGAVRFSLMNYSLMQGNVYNICSDKSEFTKIELVKKVSNITGMKFNIIENQSDPDGRDYSISCKKIQNLGFRSYTPIDTGLAHTKEWLSQELSKRTSK